MQKVSLGVSDLVTSRVAYGCWRLAAPNESAEITPERMIHGKDAVLAAYENGYTLFDLADIYSDGLAEKIFGEALRETPQMRKHILVATKCGIRKAGQPNPHAPCRYDFSAEHIKCSCDGSLQRMGVEVIDLYQLHRPDFLCNPEEVAEAFTELRQSGKVRHFGLSNARPTFFAMLQKYCPFPLIVNQVEISLLKLDCFFDGTLDQCVTERVTPLAWSPLGGGRIAYSGPIELTEPNHARRIKLRETLDVIARERGVTRSVVALAWLLKHPSGIVPIIGSTDPKNIKDAAAAPELQLTREEWYRLMEAAWGQRMP